MRLPVFFRRVSSSATGMNRPPQWASAVGSSVSNRACSSHSLRACRRYSALQSCWSKPKPARMRVSVAVPMTVSEPSAWRSARRKLRSCRNTGRQSERRARKRFSNTAVKSRPYLYQALLRSTDRQSKMSKLQASIPTQRTPILGSVLAVMAMRGNHLNAAPGEPGIQTIGIVGIVTDQMLGFILDKASIQRLLDQFDLVRVGAVDGEGDRHAMGFHHGHDLAALALLGLAHACATALGRGK